MRVKITTLSIEAHSAVSQIHHCIGCVDETDLEIHNQLSQLQSPNPHIFSEVHKLEEPIHNCIFYGLLLFLSFS